MSEKNTDVGFRIKHIWAFTTIDENDTEGVIGEMRGLGWMPFVAADVTRLEILRPRAKAIASALGKEVRLSRFSIRSDVDVIKP